MRDCNKPAVGHNLSFDLTFSLAAFAQQLPQGWLAFKQLVQRWLPGGVWDTKYLAQELRVSLLSWLMADHVLADGKLWQSQAHMSCGNGMAHDRWGERIRHIPGGSRWAKPRGQGM